MKLEDSVKRKRLGPTSKDRALRNESVSKRNTDSKRKVNHYRSAVGNLHIKRAPFK
jgi:hypothetical protein